MTDADPTAEFRAEHSEPRNPAGTLWLVASPIGNLSDLTPRAIEVLESAALVCCEDTRRTGILLRHAGVHAKRMLVTNEHTEFHAVDEVLRVLGGAGDVAVVSDAGTPGISDPGERLVRAAIEAGFTVSATPGPVAAIVALTISGLPTDRFVMEGFVPRSGRERTERLSQIAAERRTVVMYEAPHRLVRTLSDLVAVCGPDRAVVIARELTKRFETVTRGTLGTIEIGEPRGEYVIVLAGRPDETEVADDDAVRSLLSRLIASGASRRDAAARAAAELSIPKRRAYELAIHLASDVETTQAVTAPPPNATRDDRSQS